MTVEAGDPVEVQVRVVELVTRSSNDIVGFAVESIV